MRFALKLIIGFFIGLLCGLIPLIYGLLTNHKISAIIGLVASALTGVLFAFLNKQPFTAMVVAVLFVLFNIADSKRHGKSKNSDND